MNSVNEVRHHEVRLGAPAPQRVILPPEALAPWPKLQTLAKEYALLQQELKTSNDDHSRLINAREEAAVADREAFALALRQNKPEPPRREDGVATEIATLLRRQAALLEALAQTSDEIEAAITANRPEWQADVDTRLLGALEDYTAAVTALAAARRHWSGLAALRGWLEKYPMQSTFSQGMGGSVKGLRGLNGDSVPFTDVVAALAADAVPAPAKPATLHVPGTAQRWPGSGPASLPETNRRDVERVTYLR